MWYNALMVTRRELLKLFAAVPALAVMPFAGKAATPSAYAAWVKRNGEPWHYVVVVGDMFFLDGNRVQSPTKDHFDLLNYANDELYYTDIEGKAGQPIHPGDLLITRDDGLLYPFSGQHPFVGVATGAAAAGQCVEYVAAR